MAAGEKMKNKMQINKIEKGEMKKEKLDCIFLR